MNEQEKQYYENLRLSRLEDQQSQDRKKENGEEKREEAIGEVAGKAAGQIASKAAIASGVGAPLAFLAKKVGVLDSQTYFVGHSIGCQTILRYLENASVPAGGAVLVAGWLILTGLETNEDKSIAKEWLTKPISFDKIKKRSRITAVFSDDDPFVPLENVKFFEQKLASAIIIEHKKGHLNGEANVMELPSALSAVLEFANDV